MAPSLNKIFFVLFFPLLLSSQNTKEDDLYSDYKDRNQHDKFMKRRKIVSAWQINQLKQGALVVRLKTNKLAIDGLRAQGNEIQARKLEVESYAINKNTMFAYLDHFTFCKVYFIFSNLSDSLLKGARKGVFLDTNQRIDANIEMKESFYLIAERDYAYNSSIGFVPESQAKSIVEKGNPAKQMAIILKNKYGHQLKNPLPHEIDERVVGAGYDFPVEVVSTPTGILISYTINKNKVSDLEKDPSLHAKKNDQHQTVTIPKHFTYDKVSHAVDQLNDDLKRYFQKTPPPDLDKIPADVKPFLY